MDQQAKQEEDAYWHYWSNLMRECSASIQEFRSGDFHLRLEDADRRMRTADTEEE